MRSLELNPDFSLYSSLRPKFSNEIKKQIRIEQGFRCDCCGDYVGETMEIHHKIPEHMWERRGIHGKDVKENGVGLCGCKGRDCHEVFDRKAQHGIVYPDLTINDVDPCTFVQYRRSPKPKKHRR